MEQMNTTSNAGGSEIATTASNGGSSENATAGSNGGAGGISTTASNRGSSENATAASNGGDGGISTTPSPPTTTATSKTETTASPTAGRSVRSPTPVQPLDSTRTIKIFRSTSNSEENQNVEFNKPDQLKGSSCSDVEMSEVESSDTLQGAANEILNFEQCSETVSSIHRQLEELRQATAFMHQPSGSEATHRSMSFALTIPEKVNQLTNDLPSALDIGADKLTEMNTEKNEAKLTSKNLVEACYDGDATTVRKLIKEMFSVHETNEEGESLIFIACSAGHFEVAKVLVEMKANVEDMGIVGDCTPLMKAASSGFVEIVRLLLAHGADVNSVSFSKDTPLMYACAGGHVDIVKELLSHGANVEDYNVSGHTPLMKAASAGHVSVAQILLDHGAGTYSNEFKDSALTLASYNGHLEMVRFLLAARANQEQNADDLYYALMDASVYGHLEVARLLLDFGAPVSVITDRIETPLSFAVSGGHVELASLLVERGACFEEENEKFPELLLLIRKDRMQKNEEAMKTTL